ncbi:MAG TPA: HlyD family secretion protein [Marinobacter sp.]|nr:HlyD family secretion protein [Marinobacter sp.]
MSHLFGSRNTPHKNEKYPASRLVGYESGLAGKRFLLLAVIPSLIVLIAVGFYLFSGRYMETENAYVRADMISVVPEVTGRISRVAVKENQLVKAGDLLFVIDPDRYDIALEKARSELADVETQVKIMKASYQEKQQELVLAKSNFGYSEREYERQVELARKHAVSDSVLDSYRHKMQQAQQEVVQVEKGLQRIKASLNGDPDIAVEKHPLYQRAQAALEVAQKDIEDTWVTARLDGIASKIPVEGAYASPSRSAMSLVSITNIWIEANLKETQLTNVMPGQRVEIEVDAYPDHTWEGHVNSIAGAAGSEFSILPAQNATGNWVKVVQRIPVRIELDKAPEQISLLAGMSVNVSIDTGWHTRGPEFMAPLTSWIQNLAGTPATAAELTGEPE